MGSLRSAIGQCFSLSQIQKVLRKITQPSLLLVCKVANEPALPGRTVEIHPHSYYYRALDSETRMTTSTLRLLLLKGSSFSGTTSLLGGGGEKPSFSPFDVGKTSQRAFTSWFSLTTESKSES